MDPDEAVLAGEGDAIATSRFDPQGAEYDYEAATAAGLEQDAEGHWPSRDPNTGRILKGEGHETFAETERAETEQGNEIYRGADGNLYSHKKGERPAAAAIAVVPAFTRSNGDELPEVTLRESNQQGVLDTRKTDDRTGRPVPLSRTSLFNLIKGEGGSTDLPRFIALLDSDRTYIHDNDVIPVGLSAEQFNVYPPAIQRRLIAAAKARSDDNMRVITQQSIEEQGLEDLKFNRRGELTKLQATPLGGTINVRRDVAHWEKRHGAVVTPIEGMDKEQTLRVVNEFYENEATRDKLQTAFTAHPEYYRQFQALGAVEFAKRYIGDENFVKSLSPEKLITPRDRVNLNRMIREVAKPLEDGGAGVKFGPGEQVSVRNDNGTYTRTTFNEVIKTPTYTGRLHEDAIATMFTNVLDTNVERFNFKKVSREQRNLLSYVAAAALESSGLTGTELEAARENLQHLAEYGVSKLRADNYMKPKDVAVHLLNVTQEERFRTTLAETIAQNVIGNEMDAENDANYRRNIEASIQNSLRTATTARLNRQATAERNRKTDSDEEKKAGLELVSDTLTRLITLFDGSAFAKSQLGEDAQVAGLDVATYGAGFRGAELENLINAPVFAQSVNYLEQALQSAYSPYLRAQLQPMVANHLNLLVKGNAAKSWWANNGWGGRGAPLTEAGEVSPQVIFLVDGKIVYDMNQVWGPTNPGGSLPDEIRLVTDDNVQRGADITPTNIKSMVGQNWYLMLMHYAIDNANRIHKGGG